ncbi:MAG: hypothetical protein RL367_2021, partial [Pseudomonadota bacterium]
MTHGATISSPCPVSAEQDELAQISRRRAWYQQRSALYGNPSAGLTGLAVSGGGIRSATFALGVLKALSERHLLHRFDYLSTVSGGSYIGAFYGSLFVPKEARGPSACENADYDAEATALGIDPLGSKKGQEAIRRLREFGRYLAPSGMADMLYAGGILGRNWVAIHGVVAASAITVTLICHQTLYRLLGILTPQQIEGQSFAWHNLAFSPIFLLLGPCL